MKTKQTLGNEQGCEEQNTNSEEKKYLIEGYKRELKKKEVEK